MYNRKWKRNTKERLKLDQYMIAVIIVEQKLDEARDENGNRRHMLEGMWSGLSIKHAHLPRNWVVGIC